MKEIKNILISANLCKLEPGKDTLETNVIGYLHGWGGRDESVRMGRRDE